MKSIIILVLLLFLVGCTQPVSNIETNIDSSEKEDSETELINEDSKVEPVNEEKEIEKEITNDEVVSDEELDDLREKLDMDIEDSNELDFGI